ncbi:CotH kinase family protein [Streptosporangium amethystogenes]|uniref:CotH kinase family protein n=1 Tax=Streptosporangium amethystogenes TaxID=2002 RepID=UPI0004CB4C4D|nr:CotH kinase family protein [Streptosporangium amethystogenes]
MTIPTNRPRLRHRIPVRLRHHWRVVAVFAVFLLVVGAGFGTGTIRPYITTGQVAEARTVIQDIAGTKDAFDTASSHNVQLTFKDGAYQDMLEEYFKDGEKKYVEADLVIDGTTIPSVGIRLKGNSTLSGLTWNGKARTTGRGGPGGGGGRPGNFQPPEGFQVPEGFQPPEGFQVPEGFQPPGGEQREGLGGDGAGRGPGGAMTALKAEEPENLPWLISFDEFVEGRRYQGHSQMAVRPATGQSSTLLNETLAISLVGAAGEPTQRYAYSSFTVNGRSSSPRLLVEYLDEGYAERLGDGVLYKSLASSGFSYKGEDQTAYGTDFKQVNKVGGKDLQPIIDLVKWVEQASDEEFAAGLADRVDVESFARYLVLQNLMVNFDDMSGPGRNYYLWYDLDTKKFTVIAWDLNFAFSGNAKAGPNDTIGMGGGRGGPTREAGPQAQPAQGSLSQSQPRPTGSGQPQVQPTQGAAAQVQPTQGPQPQVQPTRSGQPQDGAGQGGAGREGGARQNSPMGGPRMGHALKDRFLKTPAFKKVYEEQYRNLYQKLLGGGVATALLDDIVKSYRLNEGADTAKVEADATSLRTTLKTRAEALGSDKVIAGG